MKFCVEDNHSYMTNMCPKVSQIRTLIKQLLAKYRFFEKLPQISHIHKYCRFSSIIVIFQTNCFYPTNFMSIAFMRNTLFQFCHFSAVKKELLQKVNVHLEELTCLVFACSKAICLLWLSRESFEWRFTFQSAANSGLKYSLI